MQGVRVQKFEQKNIYFQSIEMSNIKPVIVSNNYSFRWCSFTIKESKENIWHLSNNFVIAKIVISMNLHNFESGHIA